MFSHLTRKQPLSRHEVTSEQVWIKRRAMNLKEILSDFAAINAAFMSYNLSIIFLETKRDIEINDQADEKERGLMTSFG